MCGIAGFVDFCGDTLRYRKEYGDILEKLSKRGPDENGQFLSRRASLLHTRLSVVDVQNGKQPMIFNCGESSVVLSYNGELYNTEDLREELAKKGHVFKERSDTEVLLHAYLEWHTDCPLHLNGIFAFAVWDERFGKLFLCRDRMGVKPLFYSIEDKSIAFGSEVKALLCLIKPKLDINGIKELFLIGPARTPGFTAFSDIYEIKAGHYAVFDEDGFKEKSYWKLEAKEHKENLDETKEHVLFLLKDAIKRQTVSDVPLCSFLSGGLDSSAIATLSGVSRTFSVDYEDNDKYFTSNKFQPNSDGEYIKKMVDFLGVKHENIVINTQELVNALYSATEAADMPQMADVDASLLLFCKNVKKYATVALSGECADEIFGGYPWYRDEKILNRAEFPWAKTTDYRFGFLKEELKEKIKPNEYVRERYDFTVKDTEKTGKESQQDMRIKEMVRLNFDWFMQTLLNRKDRMSMFSGLEVRVPFCDHRIAEYMYNVPWEFKNLNGREKGLLREALTGVLPNDILTRKKSPYPKTHNPAFCNAVSKILSEIIENPNAPLLQIADKNQILSLINDEGSETPWFGQLMTKPQTIAYFLQMNYWLEKYNVQLVEN